MQYGCSGLKNFVFNISAVVIDNKQCSPESTDCIVSCDDFIGKLPVLTGSGNIPTIIH